MKVTKKVIANLIAENTNLDVSESIELIDKVFDLIKDSVANGDGMEIRGFGSMTTYDSKRTKVRNINKNEQMIVPITKRVKFKASKEFLKMCNRKR